MKIEEPLVIGYSRDSKGKIVGRHLKPISNTLHVANFSTTSQYLLEPTVLHMERTEEEKIRRRAHGDNRAKFSASKQLTPRIDGLSNAITTAQKDNLLCCPETETLMRVREMVKDKRKGTGTAVLEADKTIRGCYNVGTHDSTISECVIQHEDNPALTITTVQQPKMYGATTNYRIRKFTPRECFRLMGVSEHNIELIQASGVSKSQQYKNGKKIFEGDIVGSNGFVHLVKYVGNFAGFFTVSRELRGSFGYFDQKWIDYCDIVVVGNVTDNPELMK